MTLNMGASNRTHEQDLGTLLKAAEDLHGHIGPFLTLGVRLGLLGLRELRTKAGNTELGVTVTLKYALPFSCMLDGIQTATKCTVGNKRLTWKESKEDLGATFTLEKTGRQVEVKVNPSVIRELSRRLDKKQSLDIEVRRLGSEIASRTEEELFSVSHK